MHISQVAIHHYKRFTELVIRQLPASARLVVVVGPNGGGKSSLFDAFLTWHQLVGGGGGSYETSYHSKQGTAEESFGNKVKVEFHEPMPTDVELRKKLMYVRSAYRNDPDFTISGLQRTGSLFDGPRVSRLIDNDVSVANNYQRLVSATIERLYSGELDERSGREIREHFFGRVRDSMGRVFDDLVLKSPGDPLQDGSFFFDKGASHKFHYKNLSAGEKAAFDILLDLHVKLQAYDNTVFCLDEPELHMHARLQARLLEELFALIPATSQLWIATHSVGMMRKAQDLWRQHGSEVVFLDFHERDFDATVHMLPEKVTRDFWLRNLGTAVDDLATLVAPTEVILCEGAPVAAGDAPRGDFDARCYRRIFESAYPETDFASVGNHDDVETDRRWLGRTIESFVRGTRVRRLIDRDGRTTAEIAGLEAEGVRALTRRNIEAYLLDDEMIAALCEAEAQPDKTAEALRAKQVAVEASIARGNPPDDLKSASGELFVALRQLLKLQVPGNTAEAFMRDKMAPLVKSGTTTYEQLRQAVFHA